MNDFFLNQQPLVGTVSDFQPLDIVKVTNKEEEQVWDYMVRTWHYLGYQAMIGPRIKYLVLYKNKPIAAISFNQAALKISVRDSWIGLNHENILKILPHILNNNRYLILPWIKIKNLASHILSKILPYLKADWSLLYNVTPYALETFVDFSRYRGICYRAANWRYMGETSGYGKVGKTFVYHGNKKGVFFYILDKKFRQLISQFPQRQPNLKLEPARVCNIMLSVPDWSSDLFVKEQSTSDLSQLLDEYMGTFSSCYSRKDQQENGEMYIKGLLSNLNRKSIKPIALRYRDKKAVRTLQMHMKDSPWNDEQMKKIHQNRIFIKANDPKGMFTVDMCNFVKKGTKSAGVQRQYCGSKGKKENCQASVFIGYSGTEGYGLLDSCLYLPDAWFDDTHKPLWEQCYIPKTTEFRTKPQLALEMIQKAVKDNSFKFKWIGCDSTFSCDSTFRKGLPKSTLYFADVDCNHFVFQKRPVSAVSQQNTQEYTQSKVISSFPSIPVSAIAEDDSLPWDYIKLMEVSKGYVIVQVKYCRIIELKEEKAEDELWLYVRKYKNGTIKYALSNAPPNIEICELHHAATLRWPIEQSFYECKSFLWMENYETRSYVGWHRHMLLVMVAYLFVIEARRKIIKIEGI